MPVACGRVRIVARRIHTKPEFTPPQILARTLRRFFWLAMLAFKPQNSASVRLLLPAL